MTSRPPRRSQRAELPRGPNTVEATIDEQITAALDAAFEGMLGVRCLREWLHSIALLHAAGQSHAAATGGAIEASLHAAFVGLPGTGKTVAAKRVARFLHQRGITRSPRAKIVHARDLIAPHIGNTAPRVQQVVRRALGGVLFIDEAYSLVASGSERDFGHEAVATLIQQMEHHRHDLVVIFAGYPGAIQRLLDVNPGLRSRVPHVVRFRPFSQAEAFRALLAFAVKEKVSVQATCEAAWHALGNLCEMPSTGRAVRDYYEALKLGPLAQRHAVTGGEMELTAVDFAGVALPLRPDLKPFLLDFAWVDVSGLDGCH